MTSEWVATRDFERNGPDHDSLSPSTTMGYEFGALYNMLEKAKTAAFEAAAKKAEEDRKKREEEARKLKEEHERHEKARVEQARPCYPFNVCLLQSVRQLLPGSCLCHHVWQENARQKEEQHADEALRSSIESLKNSVHEESKNDEPYTQTEKPTSPEEQFKLKVETIFDSCVLPCDRSRPMPSEA